MFEVKDSGKREEFASGMVRDTAEGKMQYHRVAEGPMLKRWAEHLTKGAVKYPDNADGTANWTKAAGHVERTRFRQSAFRHFMQWFYGARDEDHAAAVLFNINGAEYVRQKVDVEALEYVLPEPQNVSIQPSMEPPKPMSAPVFTGLASERAFYVQKMAAEVAEKGFHL